MGSLSDNGGNWPPDNGSPDGLPDLPEEWGVIVVPDDLSELSEEVSAVQAELHRSQHRSRWQRFTQRPGVRLLRRLGSAGVRAPVLIISMAVLVTVASLFASAWPGPSRTPATQRTANSTDDRIDILPALELIGSDGKTVPLRAQLPAVVLLTDGCTCTSLVADISTAAPAGITVVTVVGGAAAGQTGGAPPTIATPQVPGKPVRALRDPTGELRAGLRLGPPDGTAAALLVDRDGDVVRKILRTISVEDLRPDLARL